MSRPTERAGSTHNLAPMISLCACAYSPETGGLFRCADLVALERLAVSLARQGLDWHSAARRVDLHVEGVLTILAPKPHR